MTVIVTDTEGAPAGAPAAPSADIEAAADAAVAVAEIQAGRDVAIAEIQAGTAVAAIEAEADGDEAWLRNELDALSGRLESLESLTATQTLEIQAMTGQIVELSEAMVILSSTPPPLSPEASPPMSPEALQGAEDGPKENPGGAGPKENPGAARQPKEGRPRRRWL